MPVYIVAGDSPEERSFLSEQARVQISFYGTTPNYAFQFEDLGFGDVPAKLRQAMKDGDDDRMAALIDDEMLEHFAVVGRWDDIADRLVDRYGGIAHRLISYISGQSIQRDETLLDKWCEIARAVRDNNA